jgi:hypothetical protein
MVSIEVGYCAAIWMRRLSSCLSRRIDLPGRHRRDGLGRRHDGQAHPALGVDPAGCEPASQEQVVRRKGVDDGEPGLLALLPQEAGEAPCRFDGARRGISARRRVQLRRPSAPPGFRITASLISRMRCSSFAARPAWEATSRTLRRPAKSYLGPRCTRQDANSGTSQTVSRFTAFAGRTEERQARLPLPAGQRKASCQSRSLGDSRSSPGREARASAAQRGARSCTLAQ